RARLLRRRKRQALVEEPPEGAAHPCERLCGCGTGGAKRVGVDLDAVAEPGEDDASSRTRAVEVKQQRLAAVAAELVAGSELAQPFTEGVVERRGERVQRLRERNRERVHLRPARHGDLDRWDSHGAAMLSRVARDPTE